VADNLEESKTFALKSPKQLEASKMNQCGVLGGRNIGKAAEIVTEMFADNNYTVFLTLAVASFPGGMR
jgi:deoxyhypusine synthase